MLALLGENGAGKSTLVSILFGHYVADEGTIEVFGQPLPPGQPKAALAAGIGMVHQHFTLADNLSVLDNVMLGTEPLWRPFSQRAEARAKLVETGQRFGLGVDPDARIAELSVGERQRVEILKALVRGARILILDEPTAVLTPRGGVAVRHAAPAGGAGPVGDLHQPQARRGAARVAPHRRAARRQAGGGAAGGRRRQGAAGRDDGRPPGADAAATRACAGRGGLRAAQASVSAPDGRRLLDGVDLQLRAGEIVAIAGVAGNGQQALAEVLCGLQALERRHAAAARPRAAGAAARLGARRRGAHPRRPPRRRRGRRPAGVGERGARARRHARLLARRHRQARRGAGRMRGSWSSASTCAAPTRWACTRRRARCRAATCRS